MTERDLYELSGSVAVVSILLMLPVAVMLSLVLTPLVRELARRKGWVDRPDGRRKLHPVPVPRLGGVAVHLSFVLSCGLCLALLRDATWNGSPVFEAYLHLVAAFTAVLLVGLVDDIVGVAPPAKMLVQAASGLYLYHHGYRIEGLSNPFGEPVTLGVLSLPITLVWFVGMSNAFNLIDGLDGLAAGIGLFSTSTVLIAALINDQLEIALFAAALAGALFGFLRYNFNPASVFLGDCGSLFVGFALAAFAVRGSMKSPTAIAVVAPLLAMALPILDTTIATVRRLLGGKSIFEGDRDHIHHRLLRRGLTPRMVVIVLYGVAAVFGALSLLTMTGHSQVTGLVVIVFSVMTWMGVQQLGYSEFGQIQRILSWALFQDRHANGFETEVVRRRLREARDIPELWDALTSAGVSLGIRRLELRLRHEAEPGATDAPGADDVASTLLDWRTAEPDHGSTGTWSWTVSLSGPEGPVGELTMTRPVTKAAMAVEAVPLQIVAEEFADALRRVLQAAPASGGGAGARSESAGAAGSRDVRKA